MNETINKESSSMLVPILVSSFVGAGVALLLTPKSGKDIRSEIKKFASRTGEQASGAVEKGKEIYQESKAAVSEAVSTGQKSVSEQAEKLEELAASEERSLVVPILVSGAIGAAIALLFAPKPGSEVLEDLKGIAVDTREKVKELYVEGKAAAKEAMQKGTEQKEKLRPAA